MASPEIRILFFVFLVTFSVFYSTVEAASATNEAVHRCYWCGPLAEQVHRSRRAQPCVADYEHTTVCEPGYNYCAVVATAPPYVESRLCVKLYQDECYSVFCNTTKTWKMTCPCRGDLCNGQNADREEDAFGSLTKLIAKANNVRIKRLVEEDIDAPNSNVLNNDLSKINKSEEINETIKESTIKENDMTATTHKIEMIATTETNIKINEVPVIEHNKIDEMPKIISTKEPDKMEAEITTPTTLKMVTNENVKSSVSNVATEQMPPAESLQQNGNEEKPTESTSTETIIITVTSTDESITTTSNPQTKKNSGTFLSSCKIILLLTVFITTI